MFIAKLTDTGLDFQSPFNEVRFREFCKKHTGKHVRIELPVPIRSLTQNAFYWAWLSKVEVETGNDRNETHEYLKYHFLPKRLIKVRGKTTMHQLQISGSTSGLSKVDFGEYLDKCASHVGIPLPTEDEILEMGYIR